jgi:Tfp pilus assembly protein PilO
MTVTEPVEEWSPVSYRLVRVVVLLVLVAMVVAIGFGFAGRGPLEILHRVVTELVDLREEWSQSA